MDLIQESIQVLSNFWAIVYLHDIRELFSASDNAQSP